MILEILLFFKNSDFSQLEESGYKYWDIENLKIEKSDSSLDIFSEKIGYIEQVVYNVKDPYIRIDYLNNCLGNKFKVSINEKSESSNKSSNKLFLEIKDFGNFDSVIFRLSFYNSNEDCKIRIFKIESNFLKNIDFSQKEYKFKN